jgi:hypothetical protein
MTAPKKPTHDLFYSRARDKGQKDQLTKIGAAWTHEKGDSFSLSIDVPLALTAGDRLVMFVRKTDDASSESIPY